MTLLEDTPHEKDVGPGHHRLFAAGDRISRGAEQTRSGRKQQPELLHGNNWKQTPVYFIRRRQSQLRLHYPRPISSLEDAA